MMREEMNQLKDEKSPYLLQHAHNPVDWYPWGSEAFGRAKNEQKPIFLSIGYSTCHWCHVMAYESFEDETIAHLLNETFVCIKVDREERPDIDNMYMKVCHLMTGSGGWPLTIIMTPDQKPFFAATYIPKESRYGMKGLVDLIPEIRYLWKNNVDDIRRSADTITKTLKKPLSSEGKQELTKKALEKAYQQLLQSYDDRYGGFGSQPKFPTPHNLLFLLRYWKRTKNADALHMVETTLTMMRQGGIYDHIGFGFHRYSTDRKWMVPHFEKMLYDQALLIIAYVDGYQATKKSLFKKTAEEIIEYVFRELRSEKGGFFSAEDADSDGQEGSFYLWDYDQLHEFASPDEFDLLVHFFNVNRRGTMSAGTRGDGKNVIFHQSMSVTKYAHWKNVSEENIFDQIDLIRKKLFKFRDKRVHPDKDDKILTDWNGLMVAALAKAGVVFKNDRYLKAAETAVEFIVKTMLKKNGELQHRYRDHKAEIPGFADDYAFLILGLLELYQASFKPYHLQLALNLNDYFIKHFWDEKQGGLFFTADTGEELLHRSKEMYDGAVPSANSISFYNFLRIARLTGDIDLERMANRLSKTFAGQILSMPSGYTQFLSGLDFAQGSSYQLVIVARIDDEHIRFLLDHIHSLFLPNVVIIMKDPEEKIDTLQRLIPGIEEYEQMDDKATCYICKDQKCYPPTTDIKRVIQFFDEEKKENMYSAS